LFWEELYLAKLLRKFLLISIVFLWSCLSPKLLYALEPIGSVTALTGQALDRRQETVEWLALKLTDSLFLNDTVQTKKESKIEFLMEDDSLLRLGENTELLINEHVYLPEKNRRSSVFDLISGKVRAIVGKAFTGEGSRFQVETPTAVISSRGTDFLAWVVDPQLTIVIVFSGEVLVKNILAEVAGEQILRENFMTEIGQAKPPTPPMLAPEEQKAPLIQDTQVSKKSGIQPPAQEALSQEVTSKGLEIATSPPEVEVLSDAPAVQSVILPELAAPEVDPPDLPPIPQQPTDNPATPPEPVLPPPPPPPGN
jgi:hypothetical protein